MHRSLQYISPHIHFPPILESIPSTSPDAHYGNTALGKLSEPFEGSTALAKTDFDPRYWIHRNSEDVFETQLQRIRELWIQCHIRPSKAFHSETNTVVLPARGCSEFFSLRPVLLRIFEIAPVRSILSAP